MTDVAGYRQDGGPLGGDGSVAPQVSRILTSKLPLLNTPGSVIENSLYYDVNSSSVSAVELQETFGKDKITMNSLAFGSSPTCFIPSVLFANTSYLILKLAEITYSYSAVVGNVAAFNNTKPTMFPHGWGFWAIRDIILYMGSSNIAQIQIDCYANFMAAMACCETSGKRQMVLDRAGRYLNDADPNGSVVTSRYPGVNLAAAAVTVSYFRHDRKQNTLPGFTDVIQPDALLNNDYYDDPTLRYAAVPIRLPFSSLVALEKRLSMDTKLSTQPIQITIGLREKANFCYMPDTVAKLGAINHLNAPTQNPTVADYSSFEEVSLQLWQQELSDKSLSLRNELLAMPDFNVGYPFQYLQSWSTSIPNGTALPGQDVLVNLSSIINSDLTTFFLMLTATKEETAAEAFYSPLKGVRMYDIVLQLNGNNYFRFEGDIYEAVTLSKQPDVPCPVVITCARNPAAANAAIPLGNCYSYFYELNNSKIRAIVNEAHMQNTARFTNQTWQLRFKIDQDYGRYDGGKLITAQQTNFVLHVCYSYNAVFLIGGDGGTTKLVTN